MQNEVHIEIEKIPEFQRISLAKGALALVEQVFSMPGAEERYQAWLKARKETQAAKTVEEGVTHENRKDPARACH